MAWTSGCGGGASGSSTIRARLSVPSGAGPQTSGGDTPSPSAVKRGGSIAPSAKAGLARSSVPKAPPSSGWAMHNLSAPARTLRRAWPSQCGTCSSISASPSLRPDQPTGAAKAPRSGALAILDNVDESPGARHERHLDPGISLGLVKVGRLDLRRTEQEDDALD